jgi:hypothetical protein
MSNERIHSFDNRYSLILHILSRRNNELGFFSEILLPNNSIKSNLIHHWINYLVKMISIIDVFITEEHEFSSKYHINMILHNKPIKANSKKIEILMKYFRFCTFPQRISTYNVQKIYKTKNTVFRL